MSAGRGERLADWFDGRLGTHTLGRKYLRKVFPSTICWTGGRALAGPGQE
ncbi:hypothetical protein ACFY64_14405 [Streptomyces collinus]